MGMGGGSEWATIVVKKGGGPGSTISRKKKLGVGADDGGLRSRKGRPDNQGAKGGASAGGDQEGKGGGKKPASGDTMFKKR